MYTYLVAVETCACSKLVSRMCGSFLGIGRVQQDVGDGIECDERMLVVRDDVIVFLPFKRTAVLLKGLCVPSGGKRFLSGISSGKNNVFFLMRFLPMCTRLSGFSTRKLPKI